MSQAFDLVLSGIDHDVLTRHLLPEDGKEAAAILLCRDITPVRNRLLVTGVRLVPHEECRSREPDWITWPGKRLSDAIGEAEDLGLSIILIHSHPGGYPVFSAIDDKSDRVTIPSIFSGWSGPEPQAGHGSAIMTPPGAIRGRLYSADGQMGHFRRVIVVGDDIKIFPDEEPGRPIAMAFGSGMTETLAGLHACVVGVSGTGSIIAEQAARMGFGTITLIDFDTVEPKNLNRILGSSIEDANTSAIKVEVVASAIRRYRNDVDLVTVPENIFSRVAVLAAAKADIIFSCVDSSEGRQICDLVARAFLIPLVDMGVTIPTRRIPEGGTAIAEVMGRIDYVQPGGPTLADRQVFTPTSLRAEYLARVDPVAYAHEVNEGYIRGAPREAPSVIALNMRAASAAMLEFIARAFPYRHEANKLYARTLFALADGEQEYLPESVFENSGVPPGGGLTEPLLGLPALGI
ncbi:ThiF family adenylyltransferase [Mesorhizobium sp. WSM3224]|uniref:ThiF family adenylyltransferase n=1 Tax=Mesorhizobium sp. WSM3224 TaxID=1040986 RepID=UPI0003FAD984|nr:ThiF family adenylyltransferase [Mesorhizobium sp. WSM3224]